MPYHVRRVQEAGRAVCYTDAMNKKIIGTVIIAAVVLIGAYAAFKGKSPLSPAATIMQSGSFRELAAAPSPQRCIVESTKAGATSSGTVYVASGLMRGDFTTEGTPSGTIESHLIVKNNVSYVWSSAAPQGFKLTLPSAASTDGGVSNSSTL